MSRSRATAKAEGAKHETSIANYLATHVSEFIERRRPQGAYDRGDIGGVRCTGGGRVVIECKNYGGRLEVGPWLIEAEIERGNDDAICGVVVAKRRGTTKPGDQIVLMTVDDLCALLVGVRPGETETGDVAA